MTPIGHCTSGDGIKINHSQVSDAAIQIGEVDGEVVSQLNLALKVHRAFTVDDEVCGDRVNTIAGDGGCTFSRDDQLIGFLWCWTLEAVVYTVDGYIGVIREVYVYRTACAIGINIKLLTRCIDGSGADFA